jgi:hypothetical protein
VITLKAFGAYMKEILKLGDGWSNVSFDQAWREIIRA